MRGPAPPRAQIHPDGLPDEQRVLVVANETVGGAELMAELGEMALEGPTRLYVVAPALNSRLKTWTSDEDPARAAAQRRLDATLRRLREVGIEADGAIGDVDPLVAVDDAVRTFRPTEIVVSTHPEGRSNWLERGVVSALTRPLRRRREARRRRSRGAEDRVGVGVRLQPDPGLRCAPRPGEHLKTGVRLKPHPQAFSRPRRRRRTRRPLRSAPG